ncbi:hypothetical protein KY308_03285 [Candidatus Woesearchaeota archaeon]|nr:hypothetical protein [Candidatus Woesearchaeota archaeon]
MAIPTDVVLGMRAQGLSNSQIIQALQRDSFSSQQIADAMAQADIRQDVEQMPSYGQSSASEAGDAYGGYSAPEAGGEEQFSMESLQALIEAVIEEKWQDLIKNVSRIADWKEKTDQKLVAMEQQIANLKDSFDKLHTSILEKIGEYDKTITSVGVDLKALEKVFSKILPGFMENVSELSRITEDLKGVKRK